MSYWNNLNLQIGANPYITNPKLPNIQFSGRAAETFSGVSSPYNDSFKLESNNYFNISKKDLENIAKSSDVIQSLAKKYNIPIRVNMEELENLKNGHLKKSKILAAQIFSELPEEVKKGLSMSDIQNAAMLHDYGKVLIPKKILNKEGALEGKEKEIMQLHSVFGYELLKRQGVNENVLNLIKYHHQNPEGSGYPKAENDFEYNIASQIIKAVDEYTALTEQRSYKPALSREEALSILYEDVKRGYISKDIYEILKQKTSA